MLFNWSSSDLQLSRLHAFFKNSIKTMYFESYSRSLKYFVLLPTYTKYTSEDSLSVKAGDEVRDVTLDNMLKRQEDAKRAAMTAANKNPRRR